MPTRIIVNIIMLFAYFNILIYGCSYGSHVKVYPKREIDRPYTLKEEVQAWEFQISDFYSFEALKDGTIGIPGVNPFIWKLSLTDDLQLTLFPLPLLLTYQVVYNKRGFSALDFGCTGISFGSGNGLMVETILGWASRLKLSRPIALDFKLVFSPLFLQAHKMITLTEGVEMGPFFQIFDPIATTIRVGGAMSHIVVRSESEIWAREHDEFSIISQGTYISQPETFLTFNWDWSFNVHPRINFFLELETAFSMREKRFDQYSFKFIFTHLYERIP